jgi:hypothetical protein
MVSSASNAPEAVLKFAEQMAQAHDCEVRLSREASGYHLYMPCPSCLKEHGKKEEEDPKYAINVSRYLEIGDAFRFKEVGGFQFGPAAMEARAKHDSIRDAGSSVCMRTRQSKNPHRYRVSELLNMATVHERHPDLRLKRGRVVGAAGSAEKREHWEVDPESGKECPPPPGVVVPVIDLPPTHPAVLYLVGRGFDLQKLWKQFRCSFCVEEYREGQNGVKYHRMPGGWKDTPSHRIVFYSMIDGAPMTWQARYPERVSSNGLNRFLLHPYKLEWHLTHTRPNDKASWIPVPPYDEVTEDGSIKFKPSKYRTAKYSDREMMGWDAAIERAQADPSPLKWVVLCEGPLDAARVGPGGVALIGSSISQANAEKVATNFHLVFTAFDADKAGTGATEKVKKMLEINSTRNPCLLAVLPLAVPTGKDIGEMKQEAFDSMLQLALRRVRKIY